MDFMYIGGYSEDNTGLHKSFVHKIEAAFAWDVVDWYEFYIVRGGY